MILALIAQMLTKPPAKKEFSRAELAQHVRSGAIKVICAACGARMMPNVADWIECTSCDRPMTAGDCTKAIHDIQTRKAT